MIFTYAEIDLNALKSNIKEIKKNLLKKVKFMAVVKADAYGHGAVEVSKAAIQAKVDYLSVASLKEALELRHAGVNAPILILSESSPAAAKEIIKNRLTQTIYTFELLKALIKAAKALKQKVKIHIKVDTGMGRIGLVQNDAIKMFKEITKHPEIILEGLFTHFAKADDPNSDFTNKQLKIFNNIVEQAKSIGLVIPLKHAANSAAAINFPKSNFDMIRIGLSMYGLYPKGKTMKKISLKPVLAFKTKVVYLKKVASGTPLSYGGTYTTSKATTIATLPVGYADGLSRRHSNRGKVIVRGKKFPIVGSVCMDLSLVDVNNSDIAVGDDVVVIGKQGKQVISVDEIAKIEDTISYEIICGIGKRVPRIYL